jgi:hypothetical protein
LVQSEEFIVIYSLPVGHSDPVVQTLEQWTIGTVGHEKEKYLDGSARAGPSQQQNRQTDRHIHTLFQSSERLLPPLISRLA